MFKTITYTFVSILEAMCMKALLFDCLGVIIRAPMQYQYVYSYYFIFKSLFFFFGKFTLTLSYLAIWFYYQNYKQTNPLITIFFRLLSF